MKRANPIIIVCAAAFSCVAAAAQQSPTSTLPSAPEPASAPHTLTLKETVALAVRNSRDLQLARLQYTVAQRQAGSGAAAFLPNIYAGSGAAFTHGLPLLAGGGVPAIFTASYQQDLFDPEARSQVHIAQTRADEQQIAVDAVRTKIATQQATIDRIGRQVTAFQSAVEQARAQLASADAGLKRAGLDAREGVGDAEAAVVVGVDAEFGVLHFG